VGFLFLFYFTSANFSIDRQLKSCLDVFLQFLQLSRQNGWHIMGTSVTSGNVTDSRVSRLTKPSILVLGSEGSGIRKSVLRDCDETILIRGDAGRTRWVDSLNVSVATGVLLHDLTREVF
jgi:21S rRNA (GM2251-2'-O)-methyltransferase